MRSRTLQSLLSGLLLACAGAVSAASPPERAERGFPLIREYVPILPEVESQSFDIAHDPRGFLYVANLAGLVVYDGAWWRLLPVGKARTAFAVAVHQDGRVGVGGVDDLGFLEAGADGTLRFVSLLPLLPSAQREVGQVAQVLPMASGFLFMTERWLFAWDGRTVSTVATFPGGRPFARSFRVGREIYVWTREGLARVAAARLTPVPGGEVFRGRRVDLILPADGGGLLVSVRGEGLFLFREGQAAPFAPAASAWAVEHRLYSGCRLADGRWALGSIVGGLLLLRPDGGVDQVIDTAVGLPDNLVGGAVEDHEGSLWLALDTGLVRIEVASPLSVIDVRAGLAGSVYHVARHRGRLFAATSAGLFTTAEGDGPVRMAPVPGPPSAWSLLSFGDDLLVGMADGLRVLRGSGLIQVPGTEDATVYSLARSADPDRVWLGTSDGLAAVRRAGAGWRLEGQVEGVPRDVRSIVERPGGVLWCGTEGGGVMRVQLGDWPAAAAQVRRIGTDDPANVFRIGDRLLAASQGRLLHLDEARSLLVDDPDLPGLGGWRTHYALAADAEGNLWLSTRPPSVAMRRGGGWAPELHSLAAVPARNVESIFAEPDGVVWLASDQGLFRFAGSFHGAALSLPAPHLAQATVGGGTLVFGGAPGTRPAPADLGPQVRRLRIEIAPLSFRAGLRYQTRLDPLDTGWGEATTEPSAELTRLPPGDYTFRARTLGPGGETGPETAWTFRVRPPWFQTPWALALWTGLAAAAVLGYARLRSRALVQRAAHLEARVAAQTEELRTANARLQELSLQDELTGIANRRHFQRVLDEAWSRARRQGLPLALVLFDLDHFKLLNDTRGHLEGDLCLRAVARYLAAAVRRPGDLVARYGGEEFAVLLPETGLAAAVDLAEQLRQGLERLALPHDAAPAGVVTASFGVAAWVPQPGEPSEDLIEAADLALYQAKTGGRNQVRANRAAAVSPV